VDVGEVQVQGVTTEATCRAGVPRPLAGMAARVAGLAIQLLPYDSRTSHGNGAGEQADRLLTRVFALCYNPSNKLVQRL
jgi:hypothetical protein